LLTPSFLMVLERWNSTVFSEIERISPISQFVFPSLHQLRHSVSLCVSASLEDIGSPGAILHREGVNQWKPGCVGRLVFTQAEADQVDFRPRAVHRDGEAGMHAEIPALLDEQSLAFGQARVGKNL
jgi:hypothetical protein